MILKDANIMMFSRTMELGGTSNVMLQIIEALSENVNKIIVCSSGGQMVTSLQNMGIIYYEIGGISRRNPTEIIKAFLQLKDIVLDEKITIVHSHHRMSALYTELLRERIKLKHIVTAHNTFYDKKMLTRLAYRNANVIACGNAVKRNLETVYGIKCVSVIHNSVKKYKDLIIVNQDLQDAKKDGSFLIGNIGRLAEQKGMEYYIRAIPLVIEKHPFVKFFIIGSGDDEKKLKRLCKDIGVQVFFLGYQSNIQNLMSQLDLVVLSSLWEGFPLTPIEAFSVGKTIIATNVDGTPEIVKDNGCLVDPKNPFQIAEKINWLIENPDIKQKLEKEALHSFNNEFSFEEFCSQYIQVYEQLASN